ncbi:hypothetical protein NDU88_004294 [Pleurodeles waltl]|uniref:Uncharacterized protein n=1 Tax=Pleurodeles waltl TaxID=8319 RepID=A0AAV7MT25_PLEWA|nr:hypothetical protein NDU88_004294 [Pleurodeles waltl]
MKRSAGPTMFEIYDLQITLIIDENLETRLLSELKVDTQIMLFPDHTVVIQKQRSSFLSKTCRLIELGLRYSLLFPAPLRVISEESTHFFTTLKRHGPARGVLSPRSRLTA